MRATRFPKLDLPSDYESYLQGDNYTEIAPAPASAEADGGAGAEPESFEDTVNRAVTAITSQNSLREVLYKTVCHCREPRDFADAERFIAEQDEFVYSHIIQTPYTLIHMLADAGALRLSPRDAAGEVISKARAAELSEDELDDLIEGYLVETTPAGEAAAGLLSPAVRIQSQLSQRPHRRATFVALLEFCQEPRKFPEIEEFFKTHEGLAVDVVAGHHKLSPDFYVDKLDRAGALVWRGAWVTTKEGEAFLAREKTAPSR